jgi:acetylornithine deacetylase/succinyl-diaminopimelate desuccinylase-like protein
MPGHIEAALAKVDEKELTSLLCSLVDINSPTGEEKECARFLADYMAGLGLKTHLQEIEPTRANAIGVLPGSGRGPTLLFLGHLDTTLSGRQVEDYPWVGTLPPGFRPKSYIKEGRVYGLGSFNMKGGLACAVMAVDAVRRAGVPLKGDVMVAGAAGESEKSPVDGLHRSFRGPRYNGAGFGVRYMVRHGVVCDYVIEPEPSDLYVLNVRTGYLRVKVTIKGSFAYQAFVRPEVSRLGAIEKAYRVIGAVNRWAPKYTRRNTYDSGLGVITPHVTIGAIEGGVPYFSAYMPAICNLYLDIRMNPVQSSAEVLSELEKIIKEESAKEPPFEYEIEVYYTNVPGTVSSANSYVVQAMLRAQKHVLGRKQKSYPFWTANPSSDANTFRLTGIPVVTCGPGPDGEVQAEQATQGGTRDFRTGEGEYQTIGGLLAATKMYIVAILDVCTKTREEIHNLEKGGKSGRQSKLHR